MIDNGAKNMLFSDYNFYTIAMCSPQSEAELQQLEGRKTRSRASVSSTFNDIRDVIEGQRENEDNIDKWGDFESDEDLCVEKKKKKRKVSIKKKVKVSKSKTSHNVSSATPAYVFALNTSVPSTVKSEAVLQSARDETTWMISPLPEPTVLQVANEYDMKIPNILSNVDNQDIQMLYTQAPAKNAPPSSISQQQSAKTVPCQVQKFVPGIVQDINDIRIESIAGKDTKILYTENTCSQPPQTTTPSSQLAVKTMARQVQKPFPGQVGKNHGHPQAAKIPGGRGRGRNVGQVGHLSSGRPKCLAPGVPRPAR